MKGLSRQNTAEIPFECSYLSKEIIFTMSKILIIDDDEMMCERFCILIDSLGHAAVCAHTLEQGLEKAVAEDIDIVLLDVYLPDGYGIDAVAKVRETPSKPEVIIVTAHGDPDAAEVAIKSGAWDYIEKSPTEKDMLLPLKRALAYREEKSCKPQPVVLKHEGIVGKSPAMKECLNLLAQAAFSDANVLVTGETGTGKELIARAIHQNSRRADKNFVIVDCTERPGTGSISSTTCVARVGCSRYRDSGSTTS